MLFDNKLLRIKNGRSFIGGVITLGYRERERERERETERKILLTSRRSKVVCCSLMYKITQCPISRVMVQGVARNFLSFPL